MFLYMLMYFSFFEQSHVSKYYKYKYIYTFKSNHVLFNITVNLKLLAGFILHRFFIFYTDHCCVSFIDCLSL